MKEAVHSFLSNPMCTLVLGPMCTLVLGIFAGWFVLWWTKGKVK